MSDETRLDRSLRWFKDNRVFSALMLLVIIVIGASQLVGALSTLIDKGRELGERPKPARPAPDIPAGLDFVAQYGGKGSGPGFFNDARYLTLDHGNELVVGEFSGRGRIQRLSRTGQPIAAWYMGSDTNQDYSMIGMVTDNKGAIYIGHDSSLIKRDLVSGRALGQVDFRNCDPWITAVGLQSSGPIAVCDQNLALLRYNQPNKTTIIKTPYQLNSGMTLSSHLAVDGDDNIFMLDERSSYVYKLSADGEFIARFGGEGSDPGLLDGPSMIAVDGTGAVYVGDFQGLEVFSGDGRFLRRLDMRRPQVAFVGTEMVFDQNHSLYSINNNKLGVLRVPIQR